MLAERFAIKCFTPLELTHFKDNFYTRATDNAELKYWNEKTLSDFLGIPDGIEIASGSGGGSNSSATGSANANANTLDAGPVVFRMVSYLGAFPFQNTLAPSVSTFEAMVKVAVLLTERYQKTLRRGPKDRIKLLFGSLADVGRRDVPVVGPGLSIDADDSEEKRDDASSGKPRTMKFAVDEPENDEDEDDEDDLALTALESLDAIEVFKHDQRVNKAYEARISVDTFRRLLMLLLVIAPLKPLEPVTAYTSNISAESMEAVQKEADSILAAFQPEATGISYKSFAKTVSTSLPYLFDPLTSLFEHLLFSKNLDLSHKRNGTASSPGPMEKQPPEVCTVPGSIMSPGSFESSILNQSTLSHLSFFLSCSPSIPNLFRSGARLYPVFSTAQHGSSLTSFSHHVLTWQSATLLILQGTQTEPSGQQEEEKEENLITLGAYLPEPWKSSSSSSSSSTKPSDPSTLPCLFQLTPKHTLLPGNPSPSAHKPNTPTAHFSPHTGIAIGCQIPPPSRSTHNPPTPHGAGSVLIDTSLESADLVIDPVRSDGVFLSSNHPHQPSFAPTTTATATTKTRIAIYNLEVWGFLFPQPDSGSGYGSGSGSSARIPDAVQVQRDKWAFEAREAERRRTVNLMSNGGGEGSLENARWLLEAAGVIGDDAVRRSGGSV